MTLPLKCTASYHNDFLSPEESKILFDQLLQKYKIDQLNKVNSPDGKLNFIQNGKLMFTDKDLFDKNVFPKKIWGANTYWSPEFFEIKKRVESFTQMEFQVCVCIFYLDGSTGVDFHSDHSAFGDTTVIPSLSLGEEREFQLKEKSTQEIFEIKLKEGSMIIMGENCQELYEHSLPINLKYKNPRINLTFRQYGYEN